jgi:hypothetical protein
MSTKFYFILLFLFIIEIASAGGIRYRLNKERAQEREAQRERQEKSREAQREKELMISYACGCLYRYHQTINKELDSIKKLNFIWNRNDTLFYKYYDFLQKKGYVVNPSIQTSTSSANSILFDIKLNSNSSESREYLSISFDSFKNSFFHCQSLLGNLYDDSNYLALSVVERKELFFRLTINDSAYLELSDSAKAMVRRQYHVEKPFGVIDTALKNRIKLERTLSYQFDQAFTCLLEFLYNNTGKTLLFIFILSIVFILFVEKWSNNSKNFMNHFSIFFFFLLIIFFFFHLYYCGASCLEEKKEKAIKRKEKAKQRAIKIKNEYEECIEYGGRTCSNCEEPIDCDLENNFEDYFCSKECYGEDLEEFLKYEPPPGARRP